MSLGNALRYFPQLNNMGKEKCKHPKRIVRTLPLNINKLPINNIIPLSFVYVFGNYEFHSLAAKSYIAS